MKVSVQSYVLLLQQPIVVMTIKVAGLFVQQYFIKESINCFDFWNGDSHLKKRDTETSFFG